MGKRKQIELPDYWDSKTDRLSQYLAMAQRKELNTFDEERTYYVCLRGVSETYETLSQAMYNRVEMLGPSFISRSHAAFMAAVRLALSGALPETYMVLRGALEAALYGYLCCADPSVESSWLKRNESEEFLKSCRQAFRPNEILKRIRTIDPLLGKEASDLYEYTIDHGGHPNALAILPHVSHYEEDDGSGGFAVEFLTASRRKRRPCYISCARVGLCCLSIFGLAFSDVYTSNDGALNANVATLRTDVDQLIENLSKQKFFLEDIYLDAQRATSFRELNRSGEPPK